MNYENKIFKMSKLIVSIFDKQIYERITIFKS